MLDAYWGFVEKLDLAAAELEAMMPWNPGLRAQHGVFYRSEWLSSGAVAPEDIFAGGGLLSKR